MGRLSGDRLTRLTAAYEKERAEPERTVHELRDAVSAAEQETANVQSFLKEVKKHTEPAELAPMPRAGGHAASAAAAEREIKKACADVREMLY